MPRPEVNLPMYMAGRRERLSLFKMGPASRLKIAWVLPQGEPHTPSRPEHIGESSRLLLNMRQLLHQPDLIFRVPRCHARQKFSHLDERSIGPTYRECESTAHPTL